MKFNREELTVNNQTEIILLGTFHFNHMEELIANKQEEIIELINYLAEYQPTKIAVEWEKLEKGQLEKDYNKYKKSEELNSLNEIQQIAFRLAKKLEHQTIFPVNWKGELAQKDIELLNNTIKEKYPKILNTVVSFGENNLEVNEVTKIIDSFKQLNDKQYLKDLEKMYLTFSLVTANGQNVGVDFLTKWTERELIIFKNTIELSSNYSDRILLLIGGGRGCHRPDPDQPIGWKIINPFYDK